MRLLIGKYVLKENKKPFAIFAVKGSDLLCFGKIHSLYSVPILSSRFARMKFILLIIIYIVCTNLGLFVNYKKFVANLSEIYSFWQYVCRKKLVGVWGNCTLCIVFCT
jgi:hypothetical protein